MSPLNLHPHPTGVRRYDSRVNEFHPPQSIAHRRKVVLVGLQWAAVEMAADGPGDAVINRGESFEIAFGVAGWDARACGGFRRQITLPPRQSLTRLTVT